MDVWPDAEGDYVDAQDAYDTVAILEAQIATLKTQLKDATREVASYKQVGSYSDGCLLYTKG